MSYVFKKEETPLIDSIQKELTLDSIQSYDRKSDKEITLRDYARQFIYQFQQNFLSEYALENPEEIRSFVLKNDDFVNFFQLMNPILKESFKDEKYVLKIVENPESVEDKLGLYILMDYSKSNPKDIVSKLMEFNSKIRPLKKKFNVNNKFFADVESL